MTQEETQYYNNLKDNPSINQYVFDKLFTFINGIIMPKPNVALQLINGIPMVTNTFSDFDVFGKLFPQNNAGKSFQDYSSQYATNSPFGSESIFHPDFDKKQNEERIRRENANKYNSQQEGGGDVQENSQNSNHVIVNDAGTKLNQIKHEFVSVGESIAQIKRVTSASFTNKGTIFVSQFKTQIGSRGEEVWSYKNELGTFEGTLEQAKTAFPDVDFSGLKEPKSKPKSTPEFIDGQNSLQLSLVNWDKLNEFNADENGGKPTDWNSYLDATQTALDLAGLLPGIGEFADVISGTISLARGNYAEAALNFAAAIPLAGTFIAGTKIVKKAINTAEDNKGVYDLLVKNADDIQGYVGQSQSVYKRIAQHFSKAGKLNTSIAPLSKVIHKMKGSTKFEREMYEQFIILEKYGGDITKGSKEIHKLLNKVNPVGGRFKLDTPEGLRKFTDEAIIIANKFNLPTSFKPF